MAPVPLITLLTDFGTVDPYVAILKGVILSLTSRIHLVDLTHDIPPQDVAAASFQLQEARPYFPPGTIHLAVVDPGVGTDRRAIAVATDHDWLVAPDNGLLTAALGATPARAVVALTEPRYWRTPTPSATFHGRDIFAPIAAHLARGVPLENLGSAVDPASLVTLPLGGYQRHETHLQGHIQHIDRFGNLITTFPATALPAGSWRVRYGDRWIPQQHTYGASPVDFPGGSPAPDSPPVALVGSGGWVEIARSGDSAQALYQAHRGDPVELWPLTPTP